MFVSDAVFDESTSRRELVHSCYLLCQPRCLGSASMAYVFIFTHTAVLNGLVRLLLMGFRVSMCSASHQFGDHPTAHACARYASITSFTLSQGGSRLHLLFDSLHRALCCREKFNSDYQSLQETLLKLPEKVTHDIMVSSCTLNCTLRAKTKVYIFERPDIVTHITTLRRVSMVGLRLYMIRMYTERLDL